MIKNLVAVAALSFFLGGCAGAGRIVDTILHDSSPKRVHPLDSARNFKAVVLDPAVEDAKQDLRRSFE